VATVDAALLERMARAGLRSIWFGIESGSDAVLRRLGKGFTAARAREVIAAAARLGLHTAGTFLIGVPGETAEDVEASLRLAEEGGLDEAWFQVLLGFPGTPLSRELRELSLIEEERAGLLIPRTESLSFAELAGREREIRERLGRHFRRRAERRSSRA
jgi:anaerobic magnesium-protoporphyrin IX monomethyl ester cyclase